MGLDISFEKAKRHRVEETEERLNEIKKKFENGNYSSEKEFDRLKNELKEAEEKLTEFEEKDWMIPW